ncbi:putative PDZ and LIM domain protein 7 [Scophthalmus maximus]|uniref:PDZ and LIM domain protein 7 n=1 Tax=Scophthalmus maximus TaxID=52904 RepID=A0A2U9C6W5_SCOMX|nr:putative PDZ and LIM domain protein 7 [Scophthalmus maximus]
MSGEHTDGPEAMNIYSVTLSGPAPWGFRLQGGKDFSMPLTVSRLTPGGKAAEAGVGVGDWVVSIGDSIAEDMTHVEAQNQIRAATDSLTLTFSKAFKAGGDQKMETLDKGEVTYYDEMYLDAKHGVRVDHAPCFIPNDRSKKRLIQDTEDWQPRTGTTQSRSFRILAQLTGTDFMQDPDDENMKRASGLAQRDNEPPHCKERRTKKSPRLLPVLRNSPDPNSTKRVVYLKEPGPWRPPAAKPTGPKGSATNVLTPQGTTGQPQRPRVHSPTGQSCFGSKIYTILGDMQQAGPFPSLRQVPSLFDIFPVVILLLPVCIIVTASPWRVTHVSGFLLHVQSLEPTPSPAKAQAAAKPDGSKTAAAAAGGSGPSSRPPWVTDPNFADRFRPDKTSTVVTQHQQPAQPTPMQNRSSILQAAQHAPEESGRTPTCGACNKIIRGRYLVALGRSWHPEEFTCSQCKAVLDEGGFFEERGSVYCTKCHDNRYAPNCAKCKKKITGEIMHALKMTYHVQCFKCAACKTPIRNQAFYMEEGEPYCERDYEKMFGTKCHGCDFKIDAGDRFLEALGYSWHDTCFVCALCQINLEGKTFYSKKDKPLCKGHAFAPV